MEDTSLALIERIFLTVFPLVAVVSVGFFYGRARKPDMSTANQINMDLFCPALIFSVMSSKSFDLGTYQNLALGAAAVVLGSGLLLWPICRLIGVKARTFLPPMMFSNSGNLGLPLIVLAFGEEALPVAVLLFLIENTLHFSVGVYLLDHRTHPLSLFRIPMIQASVLGILWGTFNLPLPEAVGTFINMLGQISIPLMLFALGVRMISVDFSKWRIGLLGAILCPLSGVAIALALQPLLQLSETQFGYLILFGALPPAVLNYMVAERYNQEPEQVASIVLLGNMGSLIAIPLTLAFVL